jgi:hypothetical protein
MLRWVIELARYLSVQVKANLPSLWSSSGCTSFILNKTATIAGQLRIAHFAALAAETQTRPRYRQINTAARHLDTTQRAAIVGKSVSLFRISNGIKTTVNKLKATIMKSITEIKDGQMDIHRTNNQPREKLDN